MPMDIYSTGAIRGVVRSLTTPNPALLKYFFRNVIQSEEEEILFDVEIKRRRVAPLVAPHVPGKLIASAGYRTERFKPACIKDKRALDPNRPLKRVMGEQIGGNPAMTPAAREAAILGYELQDQIDGVWRRLELMAADALVDGVVTVTGEGYPAVTVDYGRAAGHSVTLLTTARWGEADVSPIDNLQTWSTTFLQNSGLPVTDVFVDADAWGYIKADPKFKDTIDTTLRGTDGRAQLFATVMEGAQLVGMLNNTTRIWLYANWYVDPADDTEKSVLPQYSVLLGNDGADGAQAQCYGAIPDPELGYPAEMFAGKSWIEKDPAQRILLGQSCPLPVLSRPNATFYAKVR